MYVPKLIHTSCASIRCLLIPVERQPKWLTFLSHFFMWLFTYVCVWGCVCVCTCARCPSPAFI